MPARRPHGSGPGSQRQVQPGHLPGETEGQLRTPRQSLARPGDAGVVPGRAETAVAPGLRGRDKDPERRDFRGHERLIVADFTTRAIIPNNDDGDLTYYKRRDRAHLEPLVAGVGQPTQGPPRGAGQRPRPQQAARALPAGFKAEPNAQPTRPASRRSSSPTRACRRHSRCRIPRSSRSWRHRRADHWTAGRPDPFQTEWLDACKGKYNGVMHGTSRRRTATSTTPAR